jgi:ribosomal protein S8
MTQTKAVLEHLQKHGHITSYQAIELYGATRLSDIIYRLRHYGYTIITERFEVTTRYGSKTRPAKYILKGGKEIEEA